MEFSVTKDDFIQKWTEALRSGKYAKTTGRLKDSTGYCCLGVLCVIAGIPETEENGESYFMASRDNLPPRLAQYLGISRNGDLYHPLVLDDEDDGSSFGTLAEVNDDTSFTFTQIADLIEEKFQEGDFKPYDD